MKEKILSSFKEKPKTKNAWKVMWIGLSSLLVGPFFGYFMAFLRKTLDPISYNPSLGLPTGFLGVILGLGLAITSIVLFVKNYKLGERSYVLWIGLIPAILISSFWIFMIVGELLFPH